ncbi:acetyl-CoA carboxylase biotin carboxylase subunit [Ornithinibacillus contaminans]|uniref:acetyl-CoA carboxylase biotin carboxylase subunit n=1 Tax=Ornithinibacillus contaminans TaxID=694055 RepID=UPI00064DC185|nr:acetyl-CoA carboxylase biotin carboxylase subunit [Ornithinibacillus contaminans]
MITKILIANRGEIAARIIRTCKQMNIQTVAVYSEADQKAPFVKMADESYLLGPSRVQESYLNVDKILEIAKESGADAIHPGYGFLSENGSFARKCEAVGITFIGPSSSVIEMMGSKIEARKAMKKANVPIVPGTEEAIQSVEEAVEIAKTIGYPIMLKASAGGGGIGMQVVYNDAELEKAFHSNAKRAENFFGDGAMFLEKKIEGARHIEIQVLADQHGNAIHLFERECSIQRRNQKVLEEAPSPFITQETRSQMGMAATYAVKAIGYTNAGTLEFLVDQEQNFYFLEMNTRIQVEHPVTEEITGLDIVEAQIKIANGELLGIEQEEVTINGHAIEARIYAEDPITFFPSPGHLTTYDIPVGDNIRLETAVTSDYDVTPFYDPMISKLIVHGETRTAAINTLKKTLAKTTIEGIKTNVPLLREIVTHKAFQRGDTRTGFIEEHIKPVKK